jgi:hypothetical protein
MNAEKDKGAPTPEQAATPATETEPKHNDLKVASLTSGKPSIGRYARKRINNHVHFYLPDEPRPGNRSKLSPERTTDLRDALESWLRKRSEFPKLPTVDACTDYVWELLTPAESHDPERNADNIKSSTVRENIVRHVRRRLDPL